MSKAVKQLLSDELTQTLRGVGDIVVLSVAGIDGIRNNVMRLALRKKNIQIRVIKNSIARLVLKQAGLAAAVPFVEGTSAFAWGGPTIVELSKEITVWAEKVNKIQIRGGITAGQGLTSAQVKLMSTMPSRDELVGRVVNLATSPARRIVAAAMSPAARLVGQIRAWSERAEAASAAPEASDAAAAPEAAAAT